MDETVSCVIPVYNGERFLAEAIDSALAQSKPPWEIIIVDDGSTDGTADVARAYQASARYVHQQNAGAAVARHHGVTLARGDLIAFLDADDLWCPSKLELQSARFAARPELALCTTHQQNFWVEELRDEEERLREHPLSRPQPGPASTLMARRNLFFDIGPLNPELRHRDIADLIARTRAHGLAVEILPEVLTHRRIHGNNISRNRVRDPEELLRMAQAALDRRRQHS